MLGHGEYDIQLSNNVLYVRAEGGWNLQTAEAFAKDYKEISTPVTSEKWAVFNDFRAWELAPPDTNPVIQNLIQWIFDHGQMASVYLTAPSSVKIFQWTEMLAGSTIPKGYQFLRTERFDDAVNWLESLNYPIDKKLLGINP